MHVTEHRILELLVHVKRYVACITVALVAGYWISITHYLITFATLGTIGFAILVFTNIHAGIFGLLLFSQIHKFAGRAIPLPMGVNEFNLIFGVVAAVLISKYAMSKRWDFQLRERNIGNYLYPYFLIILISSFRAYKKYHTLYLPEFEGALSIMTSQFLKPMMYMGLFFVAYNFAREFKHRRLFMVAMGCWLLLYSATMFLQRIDAFPILSRQWGKEMGGVLGMSNALGILLAWCLAFFMTRKPYFPKGWPMFFPYVVAFISVVSMAYTRSRTGWLLAAAGAMALAMTSKRWLHKWLALSGVLLVVFTSPYWAPKEAIDWWYRTTVFRADDPNAVLSGRVRIWNAALEYVSESPKILLVGGGRLEFRSKGPEYGLPQSFWTHHHLLETLVSEGIVGVIIVLVLFGRIAYVLVRTWRRAPSPEVWQLARLLSIMTVLIFVSGEPIDGRLASWYWFLLGMFLAAKKSAEEEPPTNEVVAEPRAPAKFGSTNLAVYNARNAADRV